jgi:putative tributyrin esterase
MALLRCDFFSDVLGLSTSMTVILPQSTTEQIGMTGAAGTGAPPVLYLLHGLSDDDTAWLRRTSIERYVAPLGLAVVMPQVHRSFYTDQAHGGRYWTFLSEELPAIVGSFFRVSQEPEDTFVAGLSMGGYGALKWALRQPERFAAAASLSGALDMASRTTMDDLEPGLMETLYGGRRVAGSDDDLLHLLGTARPGDLPPLYVACGTEDRLVAENQRFVAAARQAEVPVTVDLGPGEHEWGYWDARIQDVLSWLPLRQGPAA